MSTNSFGVAVPGVLSSGISSGFGSVTSAAAKYLPEPATSGVGLFKDVMEVVGDVGSSVVSGVGGAIGGDFAELIGMQMEAQKEMQTTTMISNIEKSKHESKMSAVRNIRVG